MKKLLLKLHAVWPESLWILFGICFLVAAVLGFAMAAVDNIGWFLFVTGTVATVICFSAAWVKEDEPPLPEYRYFSLTNELVHLEINSDQEARDALGMIETLKRMDRISGEDYDRVKKQLTDYLEKEPDGEE